jgi:hypothetical protein
MLDNLRVDVSKVIAKEAGFRMKAHVFGTVARSQADLLAVCVASVRGQRGKYDAWTPYPRMVFMRKLVL